MKKLTIIFKGLCIFLCSTKLVDAEQVRDLIEVKCYVELIGGEHTIHYAMISPSRVNEIKNTLQGKKILLTTDQDRRVVHKVIECQRADFDFKNIHANALLKRLTH